MFVENKVAQIQLSHGLVALVDDDDYERLSGFDWIAVKQPAGFIAVRTYMNEAGQGRSINLSREVMRATDGETIKYLSDDRLDNRKSNLIVRNNSIPDPRTLPRLRKEKYDPKRKSVFIGVRWNTKRTMWEAYISENDTEKIIGRSRDEPTTAREYDLYVARNCLELPTNFPKQDYIKPDPMSLDRKCVRCGLYKPAYEFFYIGKQKTQCEHRSSRCKACRKIYARERDKKHRDEVKEFVRQVKNVPCADCHRRFPYYIMQFHHLDPTTKEFDIYSGGGRTHSIKKLKAEIEKCVIICANCHLEREWGENGILRNYFMEKYHTANV